MTEPTNDVPATTTAPAAQAPVKPGWKTTEWALSCAAMVLTALYTSGLLTNSTALAIAGIAATWLTAAGYKVSRTLVKLSAGGILVIMFALPQSGCAWLKSEGDVAKTAVVDCTTATAHDAIKEFGPILDALITQAADPNGKVQWGPLRDVTKGLGVELGGCVLSTVVARELSPQKPDPNAPKSSTLELNAAALHEGFDDIRRAQFHGATFRTDYGEL